mmetsp:Transcript_3065/g.6822  ORF Transcript_3065/g.6822 Transcript_3065/m.6822 type:complete len:187 (+) Transcript_3065:1292-1852(+)
MTESTTKTTFPRRTTSAGTRTDASRSGPSQGRSPVKNHSEPPHNTARESKSRATYATTFFLHEKTIPKGNCYSMNELFCDVMPTLVLITTSEDEMGWYIPLLSTPQKHFASINGEQILFLSLFAAVARLWGRGGEVSKRHRVPLLSRNIHGAVSTYSRSHPNDTSHQQNTRLHAPSAVSAAQTNQS